MSSITSSSISSIVNVVAKGCAVRNKSCPCSSLYGKSVDCGGWDTSRLLGSRGGISSGISWSVLKFPRNVDSEILCLRICRLRISIMAHGFVIPMGQHWGRLLAPPPPASLLVFMMHVSVYICIIIIHTHIYIYIYIYICMYTCTHTLYMYVYVIITMITNCCNLLLILLFLFPPSSRLLFLMSLVSENSANIVINHLIHTNPRLS